MGVDRVEVRQTHPPGEGCGEVQMRVQELLGTDTVGAPLRQTVEVRPWLGGDIALRHDRGAVVLPGARTGQPLPQWAGEVGVGHGPLPSVPLEIGGGIGGGFGHQQGFGVDVVHPLADECRDLVVEVVGAGPPGHVSDVDPPPIEAEWWLQPPGDHRVFLQDESLSQPEGTPIELRQRVHPEPGQILGIVPAEIVEIGFGGLRVPVGSPEPFVGVPGVVGR